MTGVVATAPQGGHRRHLGPILAVAGAATALTWAAVTAQLPARIVSFLHTWMSSLLVASYAAVEPFIYLALVGLVIMVGFRILLIPLLGPPRPPSSRGFIAKTTFAAVELALRGAMAALRLIARMLHWAISRLFAPQLELTFTITDPDGRHPCQVRITRRYLDLTLGDEITAAGLRRGGTLHAYRLHTIDRHTTGQRTLYPHLTPVTITATVITLTAAALLLT